MLLLHVMSFIEPSLVLVLTVRSLVYVCAVCMHESLGA